MAQESVFHQQACFEKEKKKKPALVFHSYSSKTTSRDVPGVLTFQGDIKCNTPTHPPHHLAKWNKAIEHAKIRENIWLCSRKKEHVMICRALGSCATRARILTWPPPKQLQGKRSGGRGAVGLFMGHKSIKRSLQIWLTRHYLYLK